MAMYLKYTSFIQYFHENPLNPCISKYMLKFTCISYMLLYKVNKSFHHLRNEYWSLDEFICINEITSISLTLKRERGGLRKCVTWTRASDMFLLYKIVMMIVFILGRKRAIFRTQRIYKNNLITGTLMKEFILLCLTESG